MTTLKVDLSGFGRIERSMSRAGRRTLLTSIGAELATSIKSRFKTNIAPDGIPWPTSKAARKRGGKTLQNTGRLRDSIVSSANSRSVRVGTNLRYAAAHQFGARARILRPRRKKALFWPGAKHPVKKVSLPALPKRPFVGISRVDSRLVREIIIGHLRR